MRTRPVVAIDGPSGAGKSTVADRLSRALGFRKIDTGALYRAVAWLADRHDIPWDDGPHLAELVAAQQFEFGSQGEPLINGAFPGEAIRTPRISRGASAVASNPEVRKALLTIQRELGREGGVVLEGRDVGTVVFPDAEVKFFLVASPRERALRRYRELRSRGAAVTLEQVEFEQEQRDRADSERSISPLLKASDADEIDCDKMTADEVVEVMKSRIRARFPLT